MADTIPQWAMERAAQLMHEAVPVAPYGREWSYAFAAYIAAHESDPLLEEARKIWAAHASGPDEPMIVAALRRGIELAKEQS